MLTTGEYPKGVLFLPTEASSLQNPPNPNFSLNFSKKEQNIEGGDILSSESHIGHGEERVHCRSIVFPVVIGGRCAAELRLAPASEGYLVWFFFFSK
jgi:phage protein U